MGLPGIPSGNSAGPLGVGGGIPTPGQLGEKLGPPGADVLKKIEELAQQLLGAIGGKDGQAGGPQGAGGGAPSGGAQGAGEGADVESIVQKLLEKLKELRPDQMMQFLQANPQLAGILGQQLGIPGLGGGPSLGSGGLGGGGLGGGIGR
jgi:hypothetical protein